MEKLCLSSPISEMASAFRAYNRNYYNDDLGPLAFMNDGRQSMIHAGFAAVSGDTECFFPATVTTPTGIPSEQRTDIFLGTLISPLPRLRVVGGLSMPVKFHPGRDAPRIGSLVEEYCRSANVTCTMNYASSLGVVVTRVHDGGVLANALRAMM